MKYLILVPILYHLSAITVSDFFRDNYPKVVAPFTFYLNFTGMRQNNRMMHDAPGIRSTFIQLTFMHKDGSETFHGPLMPGFRYTDFYHEHLFDIIYFSMHRAMLRPYLRSICKYVKDETVNKIKMVMYAEFLKKDGPNKKYEFVKYEGCPDWEWRKPDLLGELLTNPL